MENNLRKKLKDTKGITLVALIVTIIVLLILAAVSLSSIFNQDGIFSRAEQATDKFGQAKAREILELALSDAQMQKYTTGLTDEELDNKIKEIEGELLPKEKPNPNLQNVIVDGYIFEIDRSVPKIVDYKGPANGVVVTARITQNGDRQNPIATVIGKITKYGGGTVINTIATATNGVTIPEDFPTTGGNYTISNITTDTDITITTTDSEGKIATKIIHVVLVRNMLPTISEANAELVEENGIKMKIRISAKAVDTEAELASFTYSINPTTVKDNKAKGTLDPNGTPIEIETTVAENYTVTFKATDNEGQTVTATAGPVKTTDALSVTDAKRLVNSMSALKQYVGTKVDYKTGGTWIIFYYDDTGEFGSANTLYLKKKGTVNDTPLTLSTKTAQNDPAVQMMRRMNPKWASSSYSEVNLDNEKASVWLCDTSVWNSQRNSTYSSYAIGSPSIEMYMKAFNVWKTGNKDANNLVCKVESANGYSVGANGDYSGFITGGIRAKLGFLSFWE